ncbi:hypothetical protein WA026_009162 [Henosepilachna vigintioctopunctata]|uniref:Uncharacterized protein n=1 Tax=Henosepilachna vigintioctopunctata TaxID=420089 RepID=A0AAW1UV10_9CUCU
MERLKNFKIFRRKVAPINEDYAEFVEKKIPVIWVMSPENCGNSTISSMLSECSKFQLIEIDKLLKVYSVRYANNPEVIHINRCLEREMPVPCQILIKALKEEILMSFRYVEGFIISGFPCTHSQAKLFVRKICAVSVIVHINLKLDAYLTRVLFYDSKTDINKARINFIKYNRKLQPVRKNYEDKIVSVKCVYPKEDAVTRLLDILEDDYGFKFKRLYTK